MPQLLTKSVLYSLTASSFLLLPQLCFGQVHMIPMQRPSESSGGPSSGCPSCNAGAPGGGFGAGALGAAAGMVGGGRGPLNAISTATKFALPLLAVAATTGKGTGSSSADTSTTAGGSGTSGANTTGSTSAPRSGQGPLSFGPAAGNSGGSTQR